MAKELIKNMIGKRLRIIRESKKLTLKKMAALFKNYVRYDTLSKYELGHRSQDIEFLIEFGKYWKLNPEWLFYGTGPREKRGKEEEKTPEELYYLLVESLKDKKTTFNGDITEGNTEILLEMINIIQYDVEAMKELFKYYKYFIREKVINRLYSDSL